MKNAAKMNLTNWFSRRLGDGTPASTFAADLFINFVLTGEDRTTKAALEHYADSHGKFESDAFRRKTFVYLAASVGLALSRNKHKTNIAAVVQHFRHLTTGSMISQWGMSASCANEQLLKAGDSLQSLCFSPLNSDFAFAVDWSRGWLNEVGVDEENLASLFQVAQDWKNTMLFLLEHIDQERIAVG
jgi:hypothetical protein